jgi:hypothetical protein
MSILHLVKKQTCFLSEKPVSVREVCRWMSKCDRDRLRETEIFSCKTLSRVDIKRPRWQHVITEHWWNDTDRQERSTTVYNTNVAMNSLEMNPSLQCKNPASNSLHIVRSRASSLRCEYPLLSLRSSSSFLRLLPSFPSTYIPPFIFPSITCRLKQFLHKMWPIQLAFRFLI